MNRWLAVVVLVLVLSAVAVVPVAADPVQGRNVVVLTDVECANGDTFAQVLVPAEQATVGLVPSSTRLGAAKSIYLITSDDPDEWVQIFDRPGRGFPTTWCTWWQDGLQFGGDILLTPARP